jgi:simple sugar transport system permease protein
VTAVETGPETGEKVIDLTVDDDTPPSPEAASRLKPALSALSRWIVAIGGALGIFGVFMWSKGVNPFDAYLSMWEYTFTSSDSFGEVLIKATPVVFAALAVAVPAKAGLVNVGGEGQLVIGGVAAAGVSLAIGGELPGGLVLVLMLVAGALAGALWCGIAALLRLWVGINEGVTTLLLNYIAIDVMAYLVYEPWKDMNGSGQPATPPIPVADRLPLIGDSRVHLGIVLALIATVVVTFALSRTSWGFRLRVIGGNPEAGRRAGLRVSVLLLSAMLVGGALAGLGGATQLTGSEFTLRPGFLLTYGYIGFLASWLARHRPPLVAVAAVVLSAIAIGGDSLQLDSGLPAASVNVLMALILLGVFGFTRKGGTS